MSPPVFPAPASRNELRHPSLGTVLVLFGTRPEIIKLGPVLRGLEAAGSVRVIKVASGQHTDLLQPFLDFFRIGVDYELNVRTAGQTLNQIGARVQSALDPILAGEEPNLLVVQGDTTTALAGALAGFCRQIPVAHVEAGLRSGHRLLPYPEEMNRRLITQLATYHFAATRRNVATLTAEGVSPEAIFLTGNPVVDALHAILEASHLSAAVADMLEQTRGCKRLVVTAHRRESWGDVMAGHFRVLRRFVDQHPDVVLLFPVHPNPAVHGPATALLSGHDRIRLLEPLNYPDFIALLQSAWLIVSDSGGVQEEAPSLGKSLIVLRENTERPEAVEAGFARLAGERPEQLHALLQEASKNGPWTDRLQGGANPFGVGDSGVRIARTVVRLLEQQSRQRLAA
jgi:UDP-N-acetylglucosamine 2-epimerase (non-hydrolysing)